MCLVPSCNCLCSIHWSYVLCREWRCSWSSAGRRCSNYIWVINKFIYFKGAPYMRGLTVLSEPTMSQFTNAYMRHQSWVKYHLRPILLTWFIFKPSMDKLLHPIWNVRRNNLSIIKFQLCKFGKGQVVSSHTLRCRWLLIHPGIKVTPCE